MGAAIAAVTCANCSALIGRRDKRGSAGNGDMDMRDCARKVGFSGVPRDKDMSGFV